MFDRYTVLVLLQILSPVPALSYSKKWQINQMWQKACSYSEYTITEINIFHMRFWTRGSVTLRRTGKWKYKY